MLAGRMGGQGRQEAEERAQVRHQGGRRRRGQAQGRPAQPRHHQREEGQEGAQVHAQGPAVPVHERGAARAQVGDAARARVVHLDGASPPLSSSPPPLATRSYRSRSRGSARSDCAQGTGRARSARRESRWRPSAAASSRTRCLARDDDARADPLSLPLQILRDQTIPAVLVKPGVTIRPVDRKMAEQQLPPSSPCNAATSFHAAFALVRARPRRARVRPPSRASGAWKPGRVRGFFPAHDDLSCAFRCEQDAAPRRARWIACESSRVLEAEEESSVSWKRAASEVRGAASDDELKASSLLHLCLARWRPGPRGKDVGSS